MRPAYSVILFTTLSGAGYGLMTALGLMLLVGATPAAPLSTLAVGILLATVGLLATGRIIAVPKAGPAGTGRTLVASEVWLEVP